MLLMACTRYSIPRKDNIIIYPHDMSTKALEGIAGDAVVKSKPKPKAAMTHRAVSSSSDADQSILQIFNRSSYFPECRQVL